TASARAFPVRPTWVNLKRGGWSSHPHDSDQSPPCSDFAMWLAHFSWFTRMMQFTASIGISSSGERSSTVEESGPLYSSPSPLVVPQRRMHLGYVMRM